MANFFGFDKIKTVLNAIKFNGGLKGSFLKVLRYDDLKWGKLVGVDKFGNKYYENDTFFIGKNRWVEYSDKFGYDYDGSCVSAEWFGWLHYKTDLLPSENYVRNIPGSPQPVPPVSFVSFCTGSRLDLDKSRPNHKWMCDHTENLTGTPKEYVPYSTTKPKIIPWVPPKTKK